MSKRDIALKDRLAYYLLKGVNKAIRDYEMIAHGDRIAVAVSGGKDSLTLLHLLRLRQTSVPEKYETVAVHVTMLKSDGTSCTQPDVRNALDGYFQSERQACAFEAVDVDAQPSCFRCSYLRRKAIFTAAQRLGCNKVALGHHADDAAQTTLLNLFFHGKVETLNPKRQFFGGQFELIRPMIYVPEKEIVRFVRACAFPSIPAHCPHGPTSRRMLAKSVIRTLEQEYPKVKINLLRAGLQRSREIPQGVLQDGF
jgi:tRNA 2-thiocytidine biosynthesis protein TtcA